MGRSVLQGIEDDLRDVRDCIRSTEWAIGERKRELQSKMLLGHWANMLGILRRSERDLQALKDEWEQRTAQ